jgi:hypothetical protein
MEQSTDSILTTDSLHRPRPDQLPAANRLREVAEASDEAGNVAISTSERSGRW